MKYKAKWYKWYKSHEGRKNDIIWKGLHQGNIPQGEKDHRKIRGVLREQNGSVWLQHTEQ